jgi:hypothetical protein
VALPLCPSKISDDGVSESFENTGCVFHDFGRRSRPIVSNIVRLQEVNYTCRYTIVIERTHFRRVRTDYRAKPDEGPFEVGGFAVARCERNLRSVLAKWVANAIPCGGRIQQKKRTQWE